MTYRFTAVALGQRLTPPKQHFAVGDHYRMANHAPLETYWKKLAAESDRLKLTDIGTAEGSHQWMPIVSAPENLKNLEHYRDISGKLAHAEGLTPAQARPSAKEGKAVVGVDGVTVMGPELLFNGMFYGNAHPANLK